MNLFIVKLLVNCQTSFGEVLYICGNSAQLGNWNTNNAMRLYTDGTLYPKWDPYRTIRVREGNKLFFKLCIVNQEGVVRWQSIPGNRQVIPKENLTLQFTAHFEEITITSITEEIIRPSRKKTCDILNELESDGSSSKQYWKKFMNQEQQSVLYMTLTTQMRRIIEYQNEDFVIPYDQLDKHRSSSQFDKILLTKIQKTTQIIHKTSNFYCILQNTQNDELISVLGQDSYMVKLSQFNSYSIHNNQVPVFFHVQSLKQKDQNQSCFDVFNSISRIVHAQNKLLSDKQKKIEYYISVKLHWDPSRELIQKFIQKGVSLVSIQSQRILQIFLQIITSLNLEYYTHDFTQITVFLKNLCLMKVKLILQGDISFKSPIPANKKQRNRHQNRYFDYIKKVVLQESNKSFIGFNKDSFIQSIKQDETFTSLVYHRKNIVIINSEKIDDFSSKILAEITALSCKPNFQVYIILDKIGQDIKHKFPASKSNKVLVLGKNGNIYANQQTLIDIFQNLNLQKVKFMDALRNIHQSISLGIQNKSISTEQATFEFKKANVGKIGQDILKSKVKQHNEVSLHKLIYQQKDGNKISVKPFCLAEEFFLRSILQNISKHVNDDRSFVFTVNMKNDNKFVHKINTIFHRVFKQKNNVKMRTMQIVSNSEYCGVSKQQIINQATLQAQLQFMCEYYQYGSQIQPYLKILGPKKGSQSFVQKLRVQQYSSQNF